MNTSARLLAKILRRLRLATWLDIVVPITSANGDTLQIPLQRGLTEYLLTAVAGGFKADLCRLLLSRDLFPGIVCDVGVNTGQTLLELYGSGLPIHQYYGFEPNPACLATAERLIHLNPQLHTACLMPWACSDEDAPLQLFAIDEQDSGATLKPAIRPDWYAGKSGATVASYRLDTISSRLRLCDHFFMKIDVEGAELDVLKGAERLLQQHKPIIQCEVLHAHRDAERRANDRHKALVMELLRHHDYSCYLCLHSHQDNGLMGLEQIERFASSTYRESPHTCDYLFLPSELRSRVEL